MEGAKCDVDLGFFLKKSLEQLCFGLYQISMNFAEGVTLNIESTLSLTREGGEALDFNAPYTEAGGLLTLLGAEVSSARSGEDGDLYLEFSNGSSLLVSNSNSDYESYEIRNGASVTVV